MLGNKLDLVKANPSLRKVSVEEAKEYAESEGMHFVESSAKMGTGVKDAFETLVDKIYEQSS